VKASELREMTRDELGRKLGELRDELFKLRVRRSGEQLPNPLRIRSIRRDIARCETIVAQLDRTEKKTEAGNA
jgi:large subunit ribosomal protein L29